MDTKFNTKRDDQVVTTVRLPRDHYAKLSLIAKRDHRSFSAEIRRIVEQRIAADKATA